MKKTALLSVSDKTGIVDFAFDLSRIGYQIVANGGTAKLLKQSELKITELKELLPEPDVIDGKMRLCHPNLLAAILADRDEPKQAVELEKLGLSPIDLVVVNFYPVSEIVQQGLSISEAMEFIDVSSSSVLRAAAQNHRNVVALHDPEDYAQVLEALRDLGDVSGEMRQSLAAKSFHYTAYYDSTVAQFLSGSRSLLDEMVIGVKKSADLRYGENPHQQAALYVLSGARPWGLTAAALLHGKPLHFEHYLSLEVATELVAEFSEPACVIVKHANPAGAAMAHRLGEAARLAYAADPAGCTGGVAAFNREVDEDAARVLSPQYLECVAAPQFSPDAMDVLRTKKDLRLLTLPSLLLSANELDMRPVSGGLLIQEKDNQTIPQPLKNVARRPATELELKALEFAFRVAKHAKTHAMVLARGTSLLGVGCGQTSRMDALRLAIVKSQDRHPIVAPGLDMVLASDGPLTVRHAIEAADAGVSAIIQPGGSAEDKDAVKACDSRNMAMVFAGIRHHRH